MKTDIHPTYYKDAVITCACGATHKAGSTIQELKIDVCSQCHPFYTGKQDRLIDTAGRVDKFKAKMEKAKEYRKKMGLDQEEAPQQEETNEEKAQNTETQPEEQVEEVAEAAPTEQAVEETTEASEETTEEKTEETA